jgi:hypothetical protein
MDLRPKPPAATPTTNQLLLIDHVNAIPTAKSKLETSARDDGKHTELPMLYLRIL